MNHFEPIAEKLKEYGIDAMMVTSEPGEYYTAEFHGEGVALVTAGESLYITDSRYIEAARKTVYDATVLMVDRDHSYISYINDFIDRHGIKRLGIEERYMTVAEHDRYRDALHAELVPAGDIILKLRAAKNSREIAFITQAQRIAEHAFDEILNFIKPDVTEAEVAARLICEMVTFGAEKMSFDPIVVAGPNGSKPHGIPGDRPIQPGDFVTMDFGCKWGGYCSDMTRTVAVGQPTEQMTEVYNTVLEAQLAGIAASRAGVPGRAIDAAARKVIEDAGYGQYFGHGYGHSVGLEIHESPNANAREEALMPVGAVVTAEPGIYIPGKFGVRIEDMVVMQEDGCLNLTKAPKELIIL